MGGICSSHDLKSYTSVSTAKLILENGQLEEFLSPVKASQIIKINPTCFICKADDMNYDDYVSAVNGDEELQVGHLYFALPVSWLRNRLQPQQMASLAVKASLALQRANCTGRRRNGRRVDPLVYNSKMVVVDDHFGGRIGGGRELGVKMKGKNIDGRKRSEFSANLSVILE